MPLIYGKIQVNNRFRNISNNGKVIFVLFVILKHVSICFI